MVSYYNPAAMYRQQGGVPPGGQFGHGGGPIGGWYPGYHHQSGPSPQQYLNCMQESEQQVATWHHPHSVFGHQDFPTAPDYGGPALPHHHQQALEHETQLPSPQTTVSGSDLSSPGAGGGTTSPPSSNHHQQRPAPIRSPYEWIKKNPSLPTSEGGTLSSAPLLLDFNGQEVTGKTRTKDKYRVVYTDHQRVELEKEFYFSRYITIRRKSELANNLGLSERQVKIWFQNRRAKERKQMKKREEISHKNNNSPSTVSANAAVAAAAMQQLHHHQQHHNHQQALLHHQQQQSHHLQQSPHVAVSVPVPHM